MSDEVNQMFENKHYTFAESDQYFYCLENTCSNLALSSYREPNGDNGKPNRKKRRNLERILRKYPKSIRIVSGNMNNRLFAQATFASVFANKYGSWLEQGYGVFFVTIVFPKFYTGDEITNIDVPAIKKKAREFLRKIGGEYFGVVEIQATHNERHVVDGLDHGRLIVPHIHAVLIIKNAIKPRVLASELSEGLGKTVGGMKAVHIERIDPTEEDIYHVVRYMLKSPLFCKKLENTGTKEEIKAGISPQRLKEDYWKKNGRLVRRLVEIHSHLNLDSLLFASGDQMSDIKNNGVSALCAYLKAHGVPANPYAPKNAQDPYAPDIIDRRIWSRERTIGSGVTYSRPNIICK